MAISYQYPSFNLLTVAKHKHTDARSKTTSALVGGVPVMMPEKIMPMCESAKAELMNELQKKLPKTTKKADSKL